VGAASGWITSTPPDGNADEEQQPTFSERISERVDVGGHSDDGMRIMCGTLFLPRNCLRSTSVGPIFPTVPLLAGFSMNAPFNGRLFSLIAFAVVFIAGAMASPTAVSAEGPDLHDLMKGIKKSMKIVGSSVQDPAANAQVLAAVDEMEVMLLAAKGHQPSNLNDVPRADRAAHTAAFRADIARALIDTLKLEIAVLEGRRDEAMGYVRGSLKEMRDAGHEKYQPGEEG